MFVEILKLLFQLQNNMWKRYRLCALKAESSLTSTYISTTRQYLCYMKWYRNVKKIFSTLKVYHLQTMHINRSKYRQHFSHSYLRKKRFLSYDYVLVYYSWSGLYFWRIVSATNNFLPGNVLHFFHVIC